MVFLHLLLCFYYYFIIMLLLMFTHEKLHNSRSIDVIIYYSSAWPYSHHNLHIGYWGCLLLPRDQQGGRWAGINGRVYNGKNNYSIMGVHSLHYCRDNHLLLFSTLTSPLTIFCLFPFVWWLFKAGNEPSS